MYGILCTKYFLLKSTTGMCPLESAKNCVKFMLTPPLTFKLFPSTFLLLDSTEIIVKTKQCQTREILTSSLAVKGEVEKWSIASIYKSYINLKGFGSPKDCGDQIKIESPQIWIWVSAVVEIVPVVALFLCIFLPLHFSSFGSSDTETDGAGNIALGLSKEHDLRFKALVSDSATFFVVWPAYITNT